MNNSIDMTEYNLFKLTRNQIDKIKDDIKVKYEAIYQREAYYNLVTNNLDKLAKEFSFEQCDELLLARLNHRIKDNIDDWCKKYPTKTALCEPSKFYFTVKFSNGKIEFDYVPDILNDLQNGDSTLIFWKPSHQALMDTINYEYRQNPEKYTE